MADPEGGWQSGGSSKFHSEWLGAMPKQIIGEPYKHWKSMLLTPPRRRGGISGGGLANREEILFTKCQYGHHLNV